MHAVAVRGGDHVGTRLVDRRVDHERGTVDRPAAVDDVAGVVDQEQVADPHVAEAHAERVDPEVVGELGVADRDVPGDAFAEPDATEDAQRAGQLLLAVQALLLDVRKGGRAVEADCLRCQLDAVDRCERRIR